MVSHSAQEFETTNSLLCERPGLAIPSFVAPRGAARMYPSAGEDRTLDFCVWAEFIASIVPSTRLQLDCMEPQTLSWMWLALLFFDQYERQDDARCRPSYERDVAKVGLMTDSVAIQRCMQKRTAQLSLSASIGPIRQPASQPDSLHGEDFAERQLALAHETRTSYFVTRRVTCCAISAGK